jgi:DAK2 domain fusion protein YloV
MLMTVRNAWSFIAENNSAEVGVIAVRFAQGAIRGSRGNSGTILSEWLRGFAGELSGYTTIEAPTLIKAVRAAADLAYTVVQDPKEGTILTVAREIAEEAEATPVESVDLLDLLRRLTRRAQQAVARTPELLPILRKAGVVDSGAQGMTYLLEGMVRHAVGETLTLDLQEPLEEPVAEAGDNLRDVLQAEDERGHGYDVQYLLQGRNLDLAAIRAAIGNMGDSMVVTGDSELVKVHIHVHDPGVPLSYGVSLGVISDIVVENMQLQADEYVANRNSARLVLPPDPSRLATPPGPEIVVTPDQVAVITVAPGEGLHRIFLSMGAAWVIGGGQTMNPSNEAFIEAILALNTNQIIILPNNKNIVLTAQQAAREVATSHPEKRVAIIPSRTIPQGIAALLSFDPTGDWDSLNEAMTTAKGNVITGEITTASRSVDLDGVAVTEGQIIGLIDGVLALSDTTIYAALSALLTKANAANYELVTLYYGAEVSASEAENTVENLRSAFPMLEFDLNAGGQPHYPYILSIE